MEFRLATLYDLQNLKKMYEVLVENMASNGLDIWKIYDPAQFFYEDIVNKRMYILEENDYILGAFCIFEQNYGAGYINWLNKEATPLYISRLAVNVRFAKKGIGSVLIDYATKLAQEKNCNSLRLLVVNYNQPAVEFYSKNGFVKSDGEYLDQVTETITFTEYGYEYNF